MANDEPAADDAPVMEVRAMMAIEAGPGVGQPVHEMLTLSALINSDYKLPAQTTYVSLVNHATSQPEINDFLRGVIWNDDPECELFWNVPNNNLSYSTGFEWGTKYKTGGFSKPELIHRSHFGDLQWLHAMAEAGDWPNDTKAKIMQWLETMYNLATGILDPSTPIQNTAVARWFNDPSNYQSIGELLTHRHQSPANISHRALGSCFHIIQDSYAIGHTYRERLNVAGILPDRWGAIINFHSYAGQDARYPNKHKHLDHGDQDISSVDIRNLDSWNGLLGCRDAVDKCVTLANFWNRKAEWFEVQQWLDSSVFQISEKATRSDNRIEM